MKQSWAPVIAVACALFAASGCRKREAAHDHASEHPAGHDHHEPGHGHGDTPMLRLTAWSSEFEVFAEYPSLVKGKPAKMIAHVTLLEDFRPLSGAALELELEGADRVTARAKKPLRPGIFELEFTPPKAGKYRARFVIAGAQRTAIDGAELVVHASDAAAPKAKPEEDDGDAIEFLKEQQWGVTFGTAFANEGTVVDSIEVAGVVDTPPGGSADVGAPVAGRIVVPARGLVHPGDAVKKGQVLATLAPAPASPEEAARANLVQAEAEARVSSARAALERAERLVRDEAAPQRELDDARRELAVAGQSVDAARRSAQIFSGARSGTGAGTWQLATPIAGTVVEVKAHPGANIAPGELLFRVVDTEKLWVRARVPEQDAPRLRSDRDASFQVSGADRWTAIDVTGDDASATLVSVGRTVDPVSRTVDVIYALNKPNPELRVGGLVKVSLPAGLAVTGVIVPRTALIDDEGRDVVFVQRDGEHFESRTVRRGASSGDRIAITQGLKPGERIVVRGAHLIRLAARRGTSQPHGHIH